MKQGLGIAAALLLAALMTGCASQPGMVAVGSIAGLPQTLLPGAELEHARSLAMGTARSKGWAIAESAPNQLLLERTLPRDSPQAVALGLDQAGTAPRIQVETDLVERNDGVVVALRATIIANPGTESARRIDYTRDYENELTVSLSSLKSAWLSNRQKIAAEVPVPTTDVAAARADDDTLDLGDETAAPPAGVETAATGNAEAPAPSPPPEPQRTAAVPAATRSSPDVTVRAPAPEPAPAPIVAPTAPRLPAPSAAGLPAATTPALPQAPAEPAQSTVGNDMLVLNTSARKGLWAYYAEDYARLRGCALSDLGAVLLQETPSYELHEVHCSGSPNFLLRCQGGVCREMR